MAGVGLTERQREIYDWMLTFRKEKGFPPTQREIAEAFGLCGPAATNCHLLAMEKKGFIERMPRLARGIRFKRCVF